VGVEGSPAGPSAHPVWIWQSARAAVSGNARCRALPAQCAKALLASDERRVFVVTGTLASAMDRQDVEISGWSCGYGRQGFGTTERVTDPPATPDPRHPVETLRSRRIGRSTCFLCGRRLGSRNRADEHIIPRWIQERFQLWNQTLTLLNGTTIAYRQLVIRAALPVTTKRSVRLKCESSKPRITAGRCRSPRPIRPVPLAREDFLWASVQRTLLVTGPSPL
jgi:hypothetical protein